MIIALNIVISWLVLGNGDVGYGNRMCFIDNPYSRLASFIIPLGVMCICSLSFFVKTINSIRNVPKVPGNQSVRNEFVIFFRLFTITGITWVLQIIDGFLPFSTFSYISSIINSLQGIAIFVAFFLNKRVIDCKCMAQNDSHNKPLSKGESTVDSNTDVTSLKVLISCVDLLCGFTCILNGLLLNNFCFFKMIFTCCINILINFQIYSSIKVSN